VTAQGVVSSDEIVLSQVGEIEKEPKARSVTRITDADPLDPFVESRISVLPDGEQIVYSFPIWKEVREKGREGEQRKSGTGGGDLRRATAGANIWLRRGNATTRMTDGEFFDIDPMVTPDGKWIYFSSDRLGRMNIWRMQTQGRGGLTKITDSPSVAADMEVCVSPKGDKIAYTSLLAGANVYQVWFANADGTLPTQIRAGKNPAWSPDGKRVAYVAPDPVSKKDKIWVMDADGANPTQMTRGTESDDRYPVWTPDGSRIIYASNRGLNEDQEPNFDIWMMNEDGTGQTQLTINGSYDSRPAISRDGRYIYFISNRGAQRENQETLQIWRIEL
jgi:Tol biopolymer transport system component